MRWCQLRSRSYASRSGTTSIQSAGFYGRISLLGESQASIDTPAWHALDSARNEPIKGEKEAMRAGALAVLGMGLAMVCPGEGVFGQALNPALARAEAELEAFRLYAACELLVSTVSGESRRPGMGRHCRAGRLERSRHPHI